MAQTLEEQAGPHEVPKDSRRHHHPSIPVFPRPGGHGAPGHPGGVQQAPGRAMRGQSGADTQGPGLLWAVRRARGGLLRQGIIVRHTQDPGPEQGMAGGHRGHGQPGLRAHRPPELRQAGLPLRGGL